MAFYQHSSAFGQQPVLMAATPAAFGFGARGSATSPASHLQFGFGASARSSTLVKAPTPPPPVNARRRRRESTPLEDDGGPGEAMDVVGALTSKRPRREIKGIRGPSSMPARSSASPDTAPDVDLGKQLASLPKDALLTILTSLLTQHPTLKPAIQTLIPPPSIDAFSAALAQFEKRVLDSVPRGVGLRDEYIWSRVRGPLDDYVTEGRTFITAFVPPVMTTDEIAHPTTIFAFLSALTASYRRVEVQLPRQTADLAPGASSHHYRVTSSDPLAAHLLPALFNAWHTFTTRLAQSVNTQGRILSAETVRSWFRTLDTLCQPASTGDTAARRACESVRERLVREVGWTIGLRATTATPTARREDAMDDDDEEL